MKTYFAVALIAASLVLGGCNLYYADEATKRGVKAFDAAKEAKSHGDTVAANDNYRKAQLEFEIAAEQDPTGTDRHYNLATASQEMKQYDRAIGEYERALQCYPGNGTAHSGKIECLVKMGAPQGKIDKAVSSAASIVADPGRIYTALAVAYYQAGRTSDMPAVLAKAVEASPSDSYVQATAGQFYRALGDIEKAKKHLKIAYQLNPDEPWVAYDLGVLGERLPPLAGK